MQYTEPQNCTKAGSNLSAKEGPKKSRISFMVQMQHPSKQRLHFPDLASQYPGQF